MRLSFRTIAIGLWVGAAVVVFCQWDSYSQVQGVSPFAREIPQPPSMALRIFLAQIQATILSGGLLVAAGAVVWLLGEIRDRLFERRLS